MCLEGAFLKVMSFRVVTVRIHRHRRGLQHIHHRPGPSDLPRHLHGIQREPPDPQPHPGQPQLSRDAGHVRGSASGEIQLSHQRGRRLREQLPGLYGSNKQSPVGRGGLSMLAVICCTTLQTTSAPGTGIFSDFSKIQSVNISGVIRSHYPTIGTITYNAELKYFYSCAYPLEYLVNNNQVDV